ncbi:MAG: DUF4129 domain-containing protein [Planctomycetota bacterium]|nr:DUF4129 domain-containing protein [Planctomycetota bacterium]
MYEASEWWQSVAGFLQRLSRGVILPLLALLAVSVGLFLILRHIMKEKEGKKGKEEKKRESPSFPAILFYRKMLSLAERRGFIRLPNMTPYELINPLTRFFGTKGCEGVKFVTEMFVKIRYGGGSLQVDEQRRLEETVDTLSSLLRNKKN